MVMWLKSPLQFNSDDQAKDFLHTYGMRFEQTVNDNQADYMVAVSLYRQKLAGVLWFDGELEPDQNIFITLNPNVQNEDVKYLTRDYQDHTLSMLKVFCRALERPEWAPEIPEIPQNGQ